MKKKEREGAVLIMSGSPSEDGNTDAILENLSDGMVDAGFTVTSIPLEQLSISACLECGLCMQGFDCQIDDDMATIRMEMMRADVLVFALHYDGHRINGGMKKLCSRLQFFHRSERKHLLSGKKALIITTLSEKSNGCEKKLVTEFYQECLGSLGITIMDILFFDDLSMRGAIHERVDYLSKAYYTGRGLSILMRKSRMAYNLRQEAVEQKSSTAK